MCGEGIECGSVDLLIYLNLQTHQSIWNLNLELEFGILSWAYSFGNLCFQERRWIDSGAWIWAEIEEEEEEVCWVSVILWVRRSWKLLRLLLLRCVHVGVDIGKCWFSAEATLKILPILLLIIPMLTSPFVRFFTFHSFTHIGFLFFCFVHPILRFWTSKAQGKAPY